MSIKSSHLNLYKDMRNKKGRKINTSCLISARRPEESEFKVGDACVNHLDAMISPWNIRGRAGATLTPSVRIESTTEQYKG